MFRAAVLLGFGGLVPFAALSKWGQRIIDHELWLRPARRWSGRPSLNATELQVTYGCAILSFLGGPHWGFAFIAKESRARALQLVWGVTPPLIAWPAASLPAPTSLDIVSGGMVASLCVDALFAAIRFVPPSFLLIRTPLTFFATLSLLSNRPFIDRLWTR